MIWTGSTKDRRKKIKDVSVEKKEEIQNWEDEEEHKKAGRKGVKEFILNEVRCKECGRKLDLKNFSIKQLREA